MSTTIEDKIREEKRIVAFWFLYYEEQKKKYEQQREMILYATSAESVVKTSEVGKHSDVTGEKAVKLGDLERIKKWLEVVEEVERNLPLKLRIFLRLRREYRHRRGRSGWVAPIQWRFAREFSQHVGKSPEETWVESRNTFTRWWDRIVTCGVVLASKKGLL